MVIDTVPSLFLFFYPDQPYRAFQVNGRQGVFCNIEVGHAADGFSSMRKIFRGFAQHDFDSQRQSSLGPRNPEAAEILEHGLHLAELRLDVNEFGVIGLREIAEPRSIQCR